MNFLISSTNHPKFLICKKSGILKFCNFQIYINAPKLLVSYRINFLKNSLFWYLLIHFLLSLIKKNHANLYYFNFCSQMDKVFNTKRHLKSVFVNFNITSFGYIFIYITMKIIIPKQRMYLIKFLNVKKIAFLMYLSRVFSYRAVSSATVHPKLSKVKK